MVHVQIRGGVADWYWTADISYKYQVTSEKFVRPDSPPRHLDLAASNYFFAASVAAMACSAPITSSWTPFLEQTVSRWVKSSGSPWWFVHVPPTSSSTS